MVILTNICDKSNTFNTQIFRLNIRQEGTDTSNHKASKIEGWVNHSNFETVNNSLTSL